MIASTEAVFKSKDIYLGTFYRHFQHGNLEYETSYGPVCIFNKFVQLPKTDDIRNFCFNFQGQVKFHPASGSRNSLVLRDKPEDTSYWVEERNGQIHYYKNFATNGFLGKYMKSSGFHHNFELPIISRY